MRANFTLFYSRYRFFIILAASLCILLLAGIGLLAAYTGRNTESARVNFEAAGSLAPEAEIKDIGKQVKQRQPVAVNRPVTVHNLMPQIAREVNDYLVVSAQRYIKGNEGVLLTTSPYYPMALSQVEMGGEWSRDDNILAAIGVSSKYLDGHPEYVLSMTWKDMNPRPDPNAKYIGPLQLAWNYNNEWNDSKALHAARISELGRMFAANGTIRKDITRSIPNSAKPFRMVTGDRCNWTDAVNLLYWAMVLDHSQIPENSFVRQLNLYGRMAFSAMCHNYSGALSYHTGELDTVYTITETMTQEQVEIWCSAIGRENAVNYMLTSVRKARPLQYKNDPLCDIIVSNAARIVRSNYQELMGKGSAPGNIPPEGEIAVTGDREKTLYPIKVLVAYLITCCRMNGEW